MTGLLSSVLDRSTLRRWSRVADDVDTLDPVTLRRARARARKLAERLDRVIHVAEGRLAGPAGRGAAVRRPLHSDWTWRPDIWAGPLRPMGLAPVETEARIGTSAKIFHDCPRPELALRQVRNTGPTDIAPFGLRFDVFRFEGSFLSLVLDLPSEAAEDLSRRHLIRLDLTVGTESPLELFGRLNLRQGPNVAQVVREFPQSCGEMSVDFDLSLTDLVVGPVEAVWLDVIFEGPGLNQITLGDLTMSRRPRAEI